MKHPNKFYLQQAENYRNTAKKLNQQLTQLSTVRVLVFIVSLAALYFWFNHFAVAIGIGVIGMVLFLFLITKHTALKKQYRINKTLLKINEEELDILAGNYLNRENGTAYSNPEHDFSLDIDIFGNGSFFQYINRTALHDGAKVLAAILTANTTHGISKRQNTIKELAKLPKWRQKYTAIARLITTELPTKTITQWLQNYTPFLPNYMQGLPLVFSSISVIISTLTLFQIIGLVPLVIWFFLGLLISGTYVKKMNVLATNTSKTITTFKPYSTLLNAIETKTFSSEILIKKQQAIKTNTENASAIFKKLVSRLEAFDTRNNLIVALFGNALFLIDIYNAKQIENWINTYKNEVSKWIEVLAFFDAYNTLANYAFNENTFVFPTIVNTKTVLTIKNLAHPMLAKSKRIASNVRIEQSEFLIVTGANMAGKSTFLRSVSLHIVMANIGLPVCATSSTYSPIKLITSIRTSDSLNNDSSYFFAELSRLKHIVNQLNKETYFVVLDEILKGTNSADKAEGSRKFIKKLVQEKTTGIVATHDLSLCSLSKELKPVKNYFFETKINQNELEFNYQLQPGICKNKNANFLLEKMKII